MHQMLKQTYESLNWEGQGVRLLRIARLRGYKIRVQPNSTIEMRVPFLWSRQRIFSVLSDHKSWLEKALQETRQMQSRYPQYSFRQGEKYPLLGEYYELSFKPSLPGMDMVVDIEKDQIVLYVSQKLWTEDFNRYPHPHFYSNLLFFYNKKAEQILPNIFWKVVSRVGYGPKRLSLRTQKTLWGSCSRQRSSIQINKKLIAAPLFVIEYVMIHEIAHLKYPNHQKNFWNEVKSHCPEYRLATRWLKENYFYFSFLEGSSGLFSSQL